VHSNTANNPPRPQQVKRRLQRRAQPHHLNHHVGAPPIRDLLDPLHHALLISHEVQRLGAQLPRLLQSRVHTINGEKMLRLPLQRRDDGAQSHGPTANHDRDLLPSLHAVPLQLPEAVVGAEEARGEDVGHEDEGFVVDVGGRLHDGAVGVGDAHELGLAAVEGGGAEEEGGGAAAAEAELAVEARLAGGREGGDDFVADLLGRGC
jgi:hypothetical protein